MKARIAMFQRVGYENWCAVFERPVECSDGDEWAISGYTRITEWVDVEFPDLGAEDLVPAQLAALDRKAEEVKAQFTAKLREIAEARASLLALTQEGAK